MSLSALRKIFIFCDYCFSTFSLVMLPSSFSKKLAATLQTRLMHMLEGKAVLYCIEHVVHELEI